MSEQPMPYPEQPVAVQLEIAAEDEQQEDVADIDEAARDLVDYIREGGYEVTPAYSGKMGGPIFEILMQGYQILHEHKEAAGTISAYLECISVTLELIKNYLIRHRQEGKSQRALLPTQVELTIPTSNGPWEIKAPDAETAITIVKQLALTAPEKVKTINTHKSTQVKSRLGRKRQHR